MEPAMLALTNDLDGTEKMMFDVQFKEVQKSAFTGMLAALVCGGIGLHHFYMGKAGLGILYLALCWTFLPAIVGFFEAFAMPGRVETHNKAKAIEIVLRIKSARRASAGAA